MILNLITQFTIGFITLWLAIALCSIIFYLCKKIYDDCGGLVLIGFIIAIPISIMIGKLVLPYLL